MQAIRFKTYIDDDKIIKVPDTVSLPHASADIIVLIEETQSNEKQNKDQDRWQRWLKEETSLKGKIEDWNREEIYNDRLRQFDPD